MEFEWDPAKASANLRKHGVAFSEAASVFGDSLEKPAAGKGSSMSESLNDLDDELRPEYNETVLRNGVRGKYHASYQKGTNLVLLDADVARAFPDGTSVNNALRLLMRVAKTSTSSA